MPLFYLKSDNGCAERRHRAERLIAMNPDRFVMIRSRTHNCNRETLRNALPRTTSKLEAIMEDRQLIMSEKYSFYR